MGFARGRYGVEFHPHVDAERKRLKWVLPLVLTVSLISFIGYKIRGCCARPADLTRQVAAETRVMTPSAAAEPPDVPVRPGQSAATPRITPERTKPQPAPLPPAAQPFAKWQDTPRPHAERILLERFVEAERQQNLAMAIQTLEQLHERPSMADLQDPLKRRLGDLNIHRLIHEKSTPWTAIATVRRGDSLARMARERRMTSAALRKLNPDLDWNKLQPGMTVRVLDYPNAVLVVHKQLNLADLSLKNGKFFRRYYGSISPKAACNVYPITGENGATFHARVKELGLRFAQPDRDELAMLLAPGSRIIVAEQ